MEFLRKIGQVLREHHEKIILTLVLLGLAVAVAYVYQASQSEEQKLREFTKKFEKAKVNPVKAVDLSEYEAVVQVAQKPPHLDLSAPHNLLNPVKWQRSQKGDLIKVVTGTEVVDKLEITRITPLNFVIAFSRPAGPGYWINITNEVATDPRKRFIAQYTILNETNKQVFI